MLEEDDRAFDEAAVLGRVFGVGKKAVEIVEAFEQNAEHPHEPVEREKDGQQCSPQLLHGQQYDPGSGRCGIREALSPIFAD